MGIVNRVFTCDVTMFKLTGPAQLNDDGTIGGATTIQDFLAVFTDARLNLNVETDVSQAARDIITPGVLGFGKQRFKSRGWTVDLSTVVDGAADAGVDPGNLGDTLIYLALQADADGATLPEEKARGLFLLNLSVGSDDFSGYAFITSAEFRLEDGPQLQSATLTGYGPLVRA